jgi:hypothetical protein
MSQNLCSSQFDPAAEERLLGHIGMHQVCAGCRPLAAKMDCARYIWLKVPEYSHSSYFRCTVPTCVWAISGRSIIRPVMMQHMTRHKACLHLDSFEEFPEPVQGAMRNATQDSDYSDGNEDSNDFYKDEVDTLKVLNVEDEVEDEDHNDLDTFDEDHADILQGINDSDEGEDKEPESDTDNVEDLLGTLQEMSEAQLPTPIDRPKIFFALLALSLST